MRANFPVAILIGVVAEFGGIPQLIFRDAGPIATETGVVFERRPRDRIVTVSEPEEPAEAHHGVRNTTGNFLDKQVIDFADNVLANAIDAGALDVLAGNEAVIGMNGCLSHGWILPSLIVGRSTHRRDKGSRKRSAEMSTRFGFKPQRPS